VIAISSNYALYADISSRLMKILSEFALHQEIYSIDECFLDFSGVQLNEIEKRCGEAIIRAQKWLGLPISIGVAKTKTEAKIAAHLAKKFPKRFKGMCSLYRFEHGIQDLIYEKISASEIWGIGRKSYEKLKMYGIYSVKDVKYANFASLKRAFSINLEKTILELNGHSVIVLEHVATKQQIMVSRSFSRPISDREKLKTAFSKFCERACEKLRDQRSYTSIVTFFFATNRFQEGYNSVVESLTFLPTCDTIEINSKLQKAVEIAFQQGSEYKRAGVILSGISRRDIIQNSLFTPIDEEKHRRRRELMKIIDRANRKYEEGVELASSTQDLSEHFSRDSVSPHYTTRLSDIIKVK